MTLLHWLKQMFGLTMNSDTHAAKEAANMIDLGSDPNKLRSVVAIGKQLLMIRGVNHNVQRGN
jgi:high-affinity K+ transport system ATPase subunit B